jgi:hypothetical protein
MKRTSPLSKAYVTNTTSASFPSDVPTVTEPLGVNAGEAGSGIFNLVPGGRGLVPEWLLVSFFGAGSDNNTFDSRIIGWDRIGSSPNNVLWVPRILASLSCTVSAMVGVAGQQVVDTDRFVDTIVVNSVAPQPFYPGVDGTPAAFYRGTIKVFSPANDLMAWALVPLYGCEKIQFDFDMTGATNGNALFRFLRKE